MGGTRDIKNQQHHQESSSNMDRQRWTQLSAHIRREFIAGGCAGSLGIFIGFPFDIVKVKLQVFPDQYKTAWSCFKSSIKEEGILGLYKGCIPPIVIQGMINSLMFFGESAATRVLEPDLKPGEVGSPINTYMAGVAGGVLQCIALVPCEVIKCKLQTQSLRSSNNIPASEFRRTIDCIKNVYKADGLRGYYRGFAATLTREAPSIGLYFFAYKFIKDRLTKVQGLTEANSTAIMLAGGFAGALSWTGVYPCDVIKTNLQSTAFPDAPTSMVGMAKYLYKKHGMSVFFRGLGTTVIRAFPVNAATFVCYERLKVIFHFSSIDDDDGLRLS